MKTALIISTTISVILTIVFLKAFFSRFRIGIYYIDKFEVAMHEVIEDIIQSSPDYVPPVDYDQGMDLRGTPTHVCTCGSEIWSVRVAFRDYEISNYFLDMQCVNCGNLATAPTPIDKANNE
jgi:hypothetical protein